MSRKLHMPVMGPGQILSVQRGLHLLMYGNSTHKMIYFKR
jgi:hypothetical protein